MFGFETEYDDEAQKDFLKKFRERVGHLLKPELRDNDDFLLRWLRAREFDIDKAEEMLTKSMEWRAKFGADNVVSEWNAPPVLKQYFAGGISGFDKEGCPVYILPAAKLHMAGLVMSAKKNDILKYGCFRLEEMGKYFKSQSEKHNKLIDKVVLIVDLEDYSMKHLALPGIDVLLTMMGQTEANYPEYLKTCYVINAPMIFPLVYKTCKPFMSEDTKKKIVILADDYKEQLLKHISADELPIYWGGSKTDENGDIKCSSYICQGGDIPLSFYLKSQKSQGIDVRQVTVSSRSTKDIEINVDNPASKLSLCFWTESYDMKYKITRKQDGFIIIDTKRVDCYIVPEEESFEIEEPGTYVLTFDNSYSWLKTKKISYTINVKSPSNGNDAINESNNKINELNLNNSNLVSPVAT